MNSERFQRIEALYHAVRETTDEARATLLAEADPEVRREVESLLAQPDEGGFLDRPVMLETGELQAGSTAATLDVGTCLGPYRIDGKLGEGGMGAVYRATDTRLDRAVAIKVAHEPFIERFKCEAHAISSLNHPHICTLHDVGPNYLVMELVEGETLAARLKREPLPVKTALGYSAQILSALTEAHGKGIVHRDLKPGNIMIAKSGIKVLDFGLARSDRDEAVTAGGMVLGTPAYMAPEQREGKPADFHTDIYSFGCVLYEMLTGSRVALRRRRISHRKLERIVDRCLEEAPERRWQSAAELEQALAGVTATGSRGKLALAAIAVALALSAATYVYFHRTPKPTLTDKDTIVLANFANSTGDPVFDGTLRQGLSVQLEQSPFLSIVSDKRIQQTLQMMEQRPDAKLTPEVVREICLRTASAAVLDGSIAQIGTQYLLTLKAVDCSTSETLASTEVQAGDKNHVLEALGRMASAMRNKLGESLGTVRRFNTPLEQATTSSLEALQAYSDGLRATSASLAIPSLERAVEFDPKFALAYAWLGIWYTSTGEPSVAAGYTSKAYELRGRASEPEKYLIAAIYYKEVVGNLEKAEQACKLWAQDYPRAEMAHTYLAGAIYPAMGRYNEMVSEAGKAVRLNPNDSAPYEFLTGGYMALDQFQAANAVYEQASEHKLHGPFLAEYLYQIAFLQNDAAAMQRQVAVSVGQAGLEDTLLAYEANTAAYSGHLRKAEALTRRAIESAERAGKKEKAATFSATSGLREALFGNAREARQLAMSAMQQSVGVDVQYGSALALAFAGDVGRSQALADDLDRRFPEATIVQFNYLPTLRAELALDRGNPSEALEILSAAAPYELGRTTFSDYVWNGLLPVFVRGEAWLVARNGSKAAGEFQKILDHRGIVGNSPIGALAHLQLGRAYALQGNTAKARAAYRDFLALWKGADPDIPVLKQAKAEYARLQ
ncbi:MAG: serine/threonine protein kinase [Rhodanobacteraceae bacterium]|nr:MAG: serine/threonine protein kinase [Rhodanobacteraceae bacterium]